MKTLLFFLVFFAAFNSFSQEKDSSTRWDRRPKILKDAQTVQKIQQLRDSVLKEIQVQDSAVVREQVTQNYDFILELQKEQRARERKAAIVRIAIGAGLLIILIIGIARRRKKIK